MKKLIILFLLTVSICSAQTRPLDETLASFTTGNAVNSALLRANAAVTGSGTLNTLAYWNGTNSIGTLVTTTYPNPTELSYIKGLTSPIMPLLSGKAAVSHTHTIANVTGLQTALDSKQATLVSGTNIKTINGISLLGTGNIVIVSDTTGLALKVSQEVQRQLILSSESIIGTKATLDSMIVDFRKNNYLRLNK